MFGCVIQKWEIGQFMSINNFVSYQMSSQTHKNQIQSLSSLSLSQNLREVHESHIFPRGGRKSSFDLVNVFGDSNCFHRSKLEKSLDLLNSSINFNKPTPLLGFSNLLQLNEDDRLKMQKAGCQIANIDRIQSENDLSESEEQESSQMAKLQFEGTDEIQNYRLTQLLPSDLAQLLIEKEIPLEYVRGLLLVRDQKEIKSLRRLKVQRYLEKRRKKTWDKKICYNCRQKVAEQRLRIKGKFIKKRRAMQILGLTTPISTGQVKRMLEQLLKDKTLHQIQQIIRKQQ